MTLSILDRARPVSMMTTPEWLQARKIGSSDAAAICGVGKFGSPLESFLRITGQMPPIEETSAMRRGKRLEPIIAAEYEDETGARIAATQLLLSHPERPWQTATLDAVTSEGRIVEMKSVGWRAAREWGEDGTDEIPEHYLVQVMHQLAVTGADYIHVAALIGGADFRIYTVERREPLILRITEIEAEFWDRVLRRDPPPPSVPGDAELYRHLYPEASGFKILGNLAQHFAFIYSDHGRQIKTLQAERDLAKAQLLDHLGDCAEAELPDGTRIRRKIVNVEAKTIERKAYSFVDLRFSQPKEDR